MNSELALLCVGLVSLIHGNTIALDTGRMSDSEDEDEDEVNDEDVDGDGDTDIVRFGRIWAT